MATAINLQRVQTPLSETIAKEMVSDSSQVLFRISAVTICGSLTTTIHPGGIAILLLAWETSSLFISKILNMLFGNSTTEKIFKRTLEVFASFFCAVKAFSLAGYSVTTLSQSTLTFPMMTVAVAAFILIIGYVILRRSY